ncbi:Polyketide cyclase / dehydrase and lipid transport [Thermomonospora echinospora]|uniref:Polyketide cyclase / dehydrase and lipid transport n=1 Tax=Thermomonospora echinospora TaxID=1992 RepID=A0A1H5S800_9ACTN|nr:SRPBCC family protein [Thermomonospora echinospora]SEF46746.1 Polyketide cyclase / dehydrase and lipid transport [Thermomonospora echinospora]
MADRASSSITIRADRDEIMAVIADLPSYPEWAGGIRDVEVLETGPDGRPARARLTIDAGPIKDTYGLAYTWDPDGDGVHWELVEKGNVVSALHGSYRLAGAGQHTEVTYELAVDVRVPMIGLVKRKGEKMIIDSALKGLKRYVER